ncbi:MAG: P27 family phage terminase small subunit [Pseudomonadota bacterium]
MADDEVGIDAYWCIATELAEQSELSRVDAMVIAMAARAYSRWERLDEDIRLTDCELSGDKGHMSGRAQARSAAAKEFRQLIGELGLSPAARIRTSGSAQGTFFAMFGEGSGQAAAGGVSDVDIYASRLRVVGDA